MAREGSCPGCGAEYRAVCTYCGRVNCESDASGALLALDVAAQRENLRQDALMLRRWLNRQRLKAKSRRPQSFLAALLGWG